MIADQLRAIRTTAEREIERIDGVLRMRPGRAELADERREWAKLAYLADAQLQQLEDDDAKGTMERARHSG